MSSPRALGFLALLPALVLGGCATSNWMFVRERPQEKVVTKVLVRTVPSGAEVSVNGHFQGNTPIEIPVRYPVNIRVFQRREALPYPHMEEREVRTYERNVFRFDAFLMGHDRATESVTLLGEETKAVTINLKAKSK